ncbi:hypothetical protein OV203_46565 [Nannocystis sp. ILAH1]|uniref:hypothetical protein n=1 Tax=Nannocystis sp. ILAH1 TaxID=2996789 RepID=UPI00226F0BE9|nr:hypothetical protein [Nannocystis sp. ILAH1]MCY0994678.1 hypothetical protein [Nannocystis sp. ILAH1]
MSQACEGLQAFIVTHAGHSETVFAASAEAAAEMYAEQNELADLEPGVTAGPFRVSVRLAGMKAAFYEIDVIPVPLYQARPVVRGDA